MKCRHINTGEECESSTFNTSSVSEVIIYTDGWMDTDYPSRYEWFIEKTGEWMSWKDAWAGKYIINDNYNTFFFEPDNDEDRKRGYTL